MPAPGMPFRIDVAHGVLRRGAGPLKVHDGGAVSAAGSIFAVAADAARLVLPLARLGCLGGAAVERKRHCEGER